MDGPSSPTAHRAVASENGALDEQVKLLVQTEQRLYRTRNELDRQLSRIRMLGDFALQSSALESPTQILARAAGVLFASFDLDEVVTALLDRDTSGLEVTRHPAGGAPSTRSAPADPAAVEALCARQRAVVVGIEPTDDVEELVPWLDVVAWGHEGEEGSRFGGGIVVCMPLRDADEAPIGVVIATKERPGRGSYYKELPGQGHLPFLQLLSNHLEHALENSALTTRLRQRSDELADANRRLVSSLETLERTQQKLVEGQKMEAIGRLAGGVAHDFNNLLTLILGHAHLLQTTLRADPNALEDVGKIVGAAERASTITSQLLAFSRKQKRTPEVLGLNDVALKMSQMLERLVGDHIRLVVDEDPSVGAVRFDRSQLEQILLNLVVNARDAMPEGGVITIRTRPAEEADVDADEAAGTRFVALEVEDTGHGMDGETLRRIFEPFFTTKEVGHGTGMGLATVYGLVQQNDGSIRVESSVGHGSRFIVALAEVDERPAGPGLSLPIPDASALDTCILVVEDEAGVRALAARILRNGGYRVVAATDGEDALERAAGAEEPLALLLTDVAMPRMDGVELARRLREEHPDLRAVFMSGHAPETMDMPVRSPLDSFVQKPFTPAGLLEHVGRALGAGRTGGGG